MGKRIILFIGIGLGIFILSYPLHSYVLTMSEYTLSYSLFAMYLFHFIASVLVYVCLEALASYLPSEAGYGYLAFMFIKMGVFVLLFKQIVFTSENLSQPERVSLIIPLFLFLIFEAAMTGKLLNSK